MRLKTSRHCFKIHLYTDQKKWKRVVCLVSFGVSDPLVGSGLSLTLACSTKVISIISPAFAGVRQSSILAWFKAASKRSSCFAILSPGMVMDPFWRSLRCVLRDPDLCIPHRSVVIRARPGYGRSVSPRSVTNHLLGY